MKLMDLFRRPRTAPVARERLQILLAHERAASGKSDLLATLQEEIMAVIAKHFPVDQDGITVKMERGEAVSTLEVEVEIPTPMCTSYPVPAKRAPVKLSLIEGAKPDAAEPVRQGEDESAPPPRPEPACVAEPMQPAN